MKKILQHGILGVLLSAALISPALSEKKLPTEDKSGAEKTPDKITWMRYDEAMKKAREENKHLFVDFTATWCGWCKRLERDTFSQPEIIEMLDANFVSTKVWDHKKDTLDIDGYQIIEKDLGRTQYSVNSYPTLWFLSPDGMKIGPIRGYLDAENFLKALTFVKDYKYLATEPGEGTQKESEKK